METVGSRGAKVETELALQSRSCASGGFALRTLGTCARTDSDGSGGRQHALQFW
ncbi:MAG: hypothetical protein JWM60_1370, partial [Solirubrobacterales bacterium]|nr:hypothetical protein [Solirubrobacterales bacterium]